MYVMDKGGELVTIDPNRYLSAYKHRPKDQNPLYTTT